MKLTRVQRRLLKSCQKFHSEQLTIGRVLRSCLLPWSLLLLLAGYGCWQIASGEAFGWLLVGLGAGAILRDVGRLQIHFRTWPALREVINWEKVAELLNADEKSGA